MATVTLPAWDTNFEIAECLVANIALGRIGVEPILDWSEDTQQNRIAKRYFAGTRDELLRDYYFNFSVGIAKIGEDTTCVKGEWAYAYNLTSLPDITILRILRILEDDDQTFEFMDSHILTDQCSDMPFTFVGTTSNVSATITGVASTLNADTETIITGTGVALGARFVSQVGATVTVYKTGTASGSATLTCPRTLRIRYVKQVLDPSLWDIQFREAMALALAYKMAVPLRGDVQLEQVMQAEFAAKYVYARNKTSEERNVDDVPTRWTARTM